MKHVLNGLKASLALTFLSGCSEPKFAETVRVNEIESHIPTETRMVTIDDYSYGAYYDWQDGMKIGRHKSGSHEEQRTFTYSREYNVRLVCEHGINTITGNGSKHKRLFNLASGNKSFFVPYDTNKNGKVKHYFFKSNTNQLEKTE